MFICVYVFYKNLLKIYRNQKYYLLTTRKEIFDSNSFSARAIIIAKNLMNNK